MEIPFLCNGQVIKNLSNAVLNQRISHAYVIAGGAGMGKKTLAHWFAKSLQCLDKSNFPCGACTSCRALASHNHPDVFVFPKDAPFGVKEGREIVREMSIKPYQYPYKVFVIENADSMTKEGQNVLLKTLEEPPAYGVFLLLVTNVLHLLPTIVSRSAVISLRPVPSGEIAKLLTDQGLASEKDALVLAEYARGSVGSALESASSEQFFQMRNTVVDILGRLPELPLWEIAKTAEAFQPFKEDQRFLEMIALWYRDLLAFKLTGNARYVLLQEETSTIEKISKQETAESLGNKCAAVEEAKKQLQSNANFQMVCEALLLKLKENAS